MKPISIYITTAISLGLSTAGLLSQQRAAIAGQEFTALTPAQTEHLYRDLVPSRSQDFFNEGRENFEREIQVLYQSHISGNEPILKVKEVPEIPQPEWHPSSSQNPDVLPDSLHPSPVNPRKVFIYKLSTRVPSDRAKQQK